MKRSLTVLAALLLAFRLGGQEPPPEKKAAEDEKAATQAGSSPEETEEGVATGVGNHFNQTYTPLTNEKGLLEAHLTHRFRTPVIEAGANGALGLDYGNFFGVVFDYVPVRNVAVQIRRVDVNADYEFALKATVMRPTRALPLSLGFRGGIDWQTANYADRQSAGFAQLLAAYTIADRVTLSVNPACVQRTPTHGTRVCNVPLAVQVRITKSISAIGEWVPPRRSIVEGGVGQWSFSVEKSVYRHKFALWIGNSGATNVDQLLAGDFDGGVKDYNLKIGFNLLRQFDIAMD